MSTIKPNMGEISEHSRKCEEFITKQLYGKSNSGFLFELDPDNYKHFDIILSTFNRLVNKGKKSLLFNIECESTPPSPDGWMTDDVPFDKWHRELHVPFRREKYDMFKLYVKFNGLVDNCYVVTRYVISELYKKNGKKKVHNYLENEKDGDWNYFIPIYIEDINKYMNNGIWFRIDGLYKAINFLSNKKVFDVSNEIKFGERIKFGKQIKKIVSDKNIKQQIDLIKEIISVDTDGIFVENDINVDDLNIYLDNLTKELFNFPNYLHLEQDNFSGAFFRDTRGKQYILKDENDKLLFHGVSFRGSHLPRFWDFLLEEIARDMFNGNTDRKTIDITKYSVDELSQSIKVKEESSYKNKSSLSMQLIQKAKKELNMTLMDGDQLSYVKCRNGYELIVPGKTYEIDYKYYNNIIDKIYERLDIEDSRQMRFI